MIEAPKRYVKKDRRIIKDSKQLKKYIENHNTENQIVIGYKITTIDSFAQLKDIEITLAKR